MRCCAAKPNTRHGCAPSSRFGGGYDSNVNAGVAQADLSLPVFGPVTVADFGVKKGAGFAVVAAGAHLRPSGRAGRHAARQRLGQRQLLLAGIRIRPRELWRGASARSYLAGANTYSVNYAYGDILLDGDNYRSTNGLGVEWRRQLNETVAVVGRAAIRVGQLQRRQRAARCRPGVAGRRLSPVVAHRMAAGARRRRVRRRRAHHAGPPRPRARPAGRERRHQRVAVAAVGADGRRLVRAQQLRRRHSAASTSRGTTTTSPSMPASPISSPATGARNSSTSTCATIRTSNSMSTRATSSRSKSATTIVSAMDTTRPTAPPRLPFRVAVFAASRRCWRCSPPTRWRRRRASCWPSAKSRWCAAPTAARLAAGRDRQHRRHGRHGRAEQRAAALLGQRAGGAQARLRIPHRGVRVHRQHRRLRARRVPAGPRRLPHGHRAGRPGQQATRTRC